MIVVAAAGLLAAWQPSGAAQQNPAQGRWKQYRSTIAGVELSYPPGWTVRDRGEGKGWVARFVSPAVLDYDVSRAAAITLCSYPADEPPAKAECRERDSHLSDAAKDRVRVKGVLALGGLEVERAEAEDKYGDDFFFYARFTAHGRSYFVRGDFTKSFGLERHAPAFDAMLASLRTFRAPALKTFEDARLSFSVKYPASWRQCPAAGDAGRAADGREVLRLVPGAQECSGPNVITVSRSAELSGKQLTGLELQEMLKARGFTPIASALSGNMRAQGERRGPQLFRESYVYINLLSTSDLLRISERYELSQQAVQEEGREITLTLNDTHPH